MTIDDSTDMIALKQRLAATWSAGDFGLIARSYEAGAAEFIARLPIQEGHTLLDVACGTGNLSIPAAKAGAKVTGIDIAANLVIQARKRAESEGVAASFDEGDAEAMPYSDGNFDFVVSMFGAIFAPRPNLVTSELLRVTRPGGKIAMANWTAGSFVGRMFKTIATLVPPANMPSPLLWGEEATLKDRFGDGVASLQVQTRSISFKFEMTPEKVVEFWRQYYGPAQRAFDALRSDLEKQSNLHNHLVSLWTEHNTATCGTLVESEYLEVLATRA